MRTVHHPRPGKPYTSRTVLVLVFVVVFCAAAAVFCPAQTLTTLVSFVGSDGSAPNALVLASDGNFYGTTQAGGGFSKGSVFQVTPGGALTTIYSFRSTGGDGNTPQAGLIQGSDGNFYGSTTQGGGFGFGTVFKITSGGTITTLHSFTGSDGRAPVGALLQARDGNFYGTTSAGGGPSSTGTFFKITSSGAFTLLSSFNSDDGGAEPLAAVIQAADGNFYGTTFTGTGCCTAGTLFRATATGGVEYVNSVTNNGSKPSGALVQAADGTLYGTMSTGGASNDGTVFTDSLPLSAWTAIHSFSGADGSSPRAALIQASDGNFYGTTFAGGPSNVGTVFKITPAGGLTTLHNFTGADGANPQAALVQGADGKLYGTTFAGGLDNNNNGTIFVLQLDQSTLTVATSGMGTVTSADGFINCPGSCSHEYLDGTPVTLNAAPAQGWSFTGWSGACTGTGPCNITITHDTSVTATFTQVQPSFTLTVSTSGMGRVTSSDGFINCPGACSHSYLSGTQVTLNAAPAPGWGFAGWSGACTGSGPCVVTMTQNLSVGAAFSQQMFTLTVAPIGSGTVTSRDGFIHCPGACSHSYLVGTQITLNAAAGAGTMFGGWNGVCLGTGACTLNLTQSLTVDAIFSQALQFFAVTPCRVVDTRGQNGLFGGPSIQGGASRSFPIPQSGTCNTPATAAAYSLNVTVVPHGPLGFLTIWPTGENQPVVSTLNSQDGRTKANAAIVPAGTSGAVSVFVTDTTDVILDIDGYFAPPASGSLQFFPLPPCRVVDTRQTNFPPGLGAPSFGNMESRALPVLANSPCFQNLSLQPLAYSFNVTVVPNPSGQPLNYLTIWPTDQMQPVVSTLNNPTATVVANAALVPAAQSNGEVSVFTYNSTDVIIDTNGYFAAAAGGYSLYPTAPCRVLDTRGTGSGQPFSGMLSPPVNVPGSVCGPPSAAASYVFNATVVPSPTLEYLTLWADGETMPEVSTLNAYDGAITSNLAIVPNTDGLIDAFAQGTTQLILDVAGYFAQ